MEKVSLWQDDDISKFTVIDLSKEDDEEDDVSNVTTVKYEKPVDLSPHLSNEDVEDDVSNEKPDTAGDTKSKQNIFDRFADRKKVSWTV